MRTRNLPLAECILHIGCEKTGTSSLQLFLSVNRQRLAREGVLYPVSQPVIAVGSQWEYAALAQDQPWRNDMGRAFGIASLEDQNHFAERLRADLLGQISKHRKITRLIISSEHFHSRLKSPEEIGRLKAFLSPFCQRFRIIVNFRRQDRTARSLFLTHLRSGNPSPKPFLPTMDLPESCYYRYDDVYDNWAAVFSPETIRPGIFVESPPTTHYLLEDFCKVADLNFANKVAPEPRNTSLTPAAARFLMEINRHWPEPPTEEALLHRGLLIAELERLLPGKLFPFDRSTAIIFYQQFQEANQRLAARAFPGRPQPLFDEDFSEYPDVVRWQDTSPGEITGVSLKVIRSLFRQLNEEKPPGIFAQACSRAKSAWQNRWRPLDRNEETLP